MLNTVYRLTEPGKFEAEFTEVGLDNDHIIVRPTFLSICHADQRYYQGTRDIKVLKKKLPMSLIHEGIGEIVYDPENEFRVGQRVVMIPNTPKETDDIVAENYLRSSRFRGSGYDGFMQDNVSMERNRVLALPDSIDDHVAAFTELVTVSFHAISRFINRSNKRRTVIGVWGDGNLAFITSLLLKKRLPESKVFVFGKHDHKLQDFVFADGIYNISDVPDDVFIDHAFECVGNAASGDAINQIIDLIKPEGTISIMGVSENPVQINTRMVLEKGLEIFGSSRSGREDFEATLALYEQKPEIQEYLSDIVGDVVEIKEIKDINNAFDLDNRSGAKKTIMVWKK